MASLKDIAGVCGVSIATVSKALNDQKDISDATKDKIRQVARDLGYQPNQSAKALKTHRTYNIGILFADEDRSGLTQDYFAGILDSFMKTAQAKGYDLTFMHCEKTSAFGMSYLEHARSRSFDGVVIACVDFESPEVIRLVQSDIPIVTIDYVFNNCMSVLSDNAEGMKDLLSFIVEKGHKKIAYIHGESCAVTRQRLSSFYRTAMEQNLEIPEDYILECPYRDIKTCYKLTKQLLEMKDPPTCILFPDDYAGIGGLNAIRDKNPVVPDDISAAGYGGSPFGYDLEPQLTTYVRDTEAIGKVAAENLIRLIESPKTTMIESVTVKGCVREGRSVKQI